MMKRFGNVVENNQIFFKNLLCFFVCPKIIHDHL